MKNKYFAGLILSLTMASLFIQFPAIAQSSAAVDSFRVIGSSGAYVELELVAHNDDPKSEICFFTSARSRDGSIGSWQSPGIRMESGKHKTLLGHVHRPLKSMEHQTNQLVIAIRDCRNRGPSVLQYFDWTYTWPEYPMYDNYEAPGDKYDYFTAGLLHNGEYELLDSLIEKWTKLDRKDARNDDGDWKLGIFRDTIEAQLRSKQREYLYKQFENWRNSNPKSPGASIGEAYYWIASAWNILGGRHSPNSDPLARRMFLDRMHKAEQILERSKKFASKNPLWHDAYLSIAIATNKKESAILKLFTEATRMHGEYLPIYVTMAEYWSPIASKKSSWARLAEMVNNASLRASKDERDLSYAWLYAQITYRRHHNIGLLHNGYVSWPFMKNSLESLVQKYPTAPNLNMYALFACQAADNERYLTLRNRIGKDIVPNMWPPQYSIDLCDRRFYVPA